MREHRYSRVWEKDQQHKKKENHEIVGRCVFVYARKNRIQMACQRLLLVCLD